MVHDNIAGIVVAFNSVLLMISVQFIHDLHLLCLRKVVRQNLLKSEEAKRRKKKVRVRFSDFVSSISPKMFRRMFRMPYECFMLLCRNIEDGVGRDEFLGEEYIEKELNSGKKKGRMKAAHMEASGGYISGEVKVALTLRLLAGASYLDISYIFDIFYTSTFRIFHHVCQEWLCQDWVNEYVLETYIGNPEKLYQISKEFTAKGRSNGILGGIIGALDGWLVKIRSPSFVRDGVRNAAAFFSRKGFFALNVQVIVDRNKKVLWRSINSKGSEHDSSSFKDTSLYKNLTEIFGEGKDNPLCYDGIQLYLVGDSAYALRPFLLCPYDGAEPGTPEDVFNFMLSSNRIFVECTFGEIDARFGIFWRPLAFDLAKDKFVIDSCMRVHNFLVDYRMEKNADGDWEADIAYYDSECLSFIIDNPDICVGAYGNGSIGMGRPTIDEAIMRESGSILRDHLRDRMASLNLKRVTREWNMTSCHHTVESSN